MKCPKEDKLLQFVDELLEQEEYEQVQKHIKSCLYCEQQVEVLKNEQAFLAETLKTPTLPDHFADLIVADLEPYKQRPKRKVKWALGAAASLLMATGISMSVSPTFAQFISGIFTSDSVDEGIQIAAKSEISKQLNMEVTDQGITLRLEDMIVDTSRIVVSYVVQDSNGNVLDPYFTSAEDKENKITLLDSAGKNIITDWGWRNADGHGVVEFSLIGIDSVDASTIQFDIAKIAGERGNWYLEAPFDLTKANELQKVVGIDDSYTLNGNKITLDEIRYATSSTEIVYETDLTDEARKALEADVNRKVKQFGTNIVNTFETYGPTIGYYIENEQGEVVSYTNVFAREDRGHMVSYNLLSGTNAPLDKFGSRVWTDSYSPKKGKENLYFVLDTVYETVPADFSVTFSTKDLPYTFDYNGHEMTVESIGNDVNDMFEEAVKEQRLQMKFQLSGYKEWKSNMLGKWAIEDNKGNIYEVHYSGTTYDETDDKGRFKFDNSLYTTVEVKEIPEEITLHLISETRVTELKEQWRVPLFK